MSDEILEGANVSLDEYMEMTRVLRKSRDNPAIHVAITEALRFADFAGVTRPQDQDELSSRIQTAVHLAQLIVYAEFQDLTVDDYNLANSPPEVHKLVMETMKEEFADDPHAYVRETQFREKDIPCNHDTDPLGPELPDGLVPLPNPRDMSREAFAKTVKKQFNKMTERPEDDALPEPIEDLLDKKIAWLYAELEEQDKREVRRSRPR